MSFRLEVRDLPAARQGDYKQRQKDHTNTLQKLQADFTAAKEEMTRTGLMGAATTGRDVNTMSTGEVIQEGKNIQAQSKQSTQRSLRLIDETIAVGAATNERLAAQTDQLQRINEHVDEIDSNMKRANKQLRVFAKRMMTDKMIICLVFLVLVMLIVSVVYGSIKGKNNKTTQGTDSFKPT